MKTEFLERLQSKAMGCGLPCQLILVSEKLLSLRLANSQIIQPAVSENFFAFVKIEKRGRVTSSMAAGPEAWAVDEAWQGAAEAEQGPKTGPLLLAPACRQPDLDCPPPPEPRECLAYAEDVLGKYQKCAGRLAVRQRQVAVINSAGLLRTHAGQLAHFFVSDLGYFEAAAPSFRELRRLPCELLAAPDKPKAIPQGGCRALLGSRAVSDLVEGICQCGFGGREFLEGRSFLNETNLVGNENFTLTDDWRLTGGLPFDFEGTSRSCLPLAERGQGQGPVTDLALAARLSSTSTGHCLPPWEDDGALPLDLVLAAEEEDLLSTLGDGLYLPRFHYLGLVDPQTATFTGTIRDCLWIEDGRPVGTVPPLRFTVSFLALAREIQAVGKERKLMAGSWGNNLVPELIVSRFNFE
jgi:predicted Zn-dependent protease